MKLTRESHVRHNDSHARLFTPLGRLIVSMLLALFIVGVIALMRCL